MHVDFVSQRNWRNVVHQTCFYTFCRRTFPVVTVFTNLLLLFFDTVSFCFEEKIHVHLNASNVDLHEI